MELYKKYRPSSFDQIAGNSETVKILTSVLKKEKVPHAILLTGPRGCGKTTIGTILAKELNSTGLDFTELDTGLFRGIDTVRDIRKQINYGPRESKCKVWLIDEVHMLGRGGDSSKNEAQNALLKILENCPESSYFILCTTNPEMLLKTVRDRCMQLEVKTLAAPQLIKVLESISNQENQKISKAVLKVIAKTSKGHVRNAIQRLEKVLSVSDPKKQLKIAKTIEDDEEKQVIELCRLLMYETDWNKTRAVLNKLKKSEAESIRRQIIGYANSALLNGAEEASSILGWFLYKNTFGSDFALITQFCYNIVKEIEPPC